MRYVTAIIGAVFIFLAVILIGFFVNAFLPPTMQRTTRISFGFFSVGGTPALLLGIPLAGFAAVHSFRSTLKRYAQRSRKESSAGAGGVENKLNRSH